LGEAEQWMRGSPCSEAAAASSAFYRWRCICAAANRTRAGEARVNTAEKCEEATAAVQVAESARLAAVNDAMSARDDAAAAAAAADERQGGCHSPNFLLNLRHFCH